MDAYLISNFIKKSLQKKSILEHADFLVPNNTMRNTPSIAPSANPQIIDNSINDYSTNTDITNIIIDDNKNDDDDDEEENTSDSSASKISTGTFVLLLLINSYAAYLSWDCNTSKNYPLMLKIVFSLFAFMFGTLYIMYYMLFRFDDCNTFRPE